MSLSAINVWWLAIRPKTLAASLSPVLMGTAMAYGAGFFDSLIFVVTLGCALLIQILTNFINDLYDFKNGVDTTERMGPTRVTQSGLATPKQMMVAIVFVLILITAGAFYLVTIGGKPIALIGILSILSAYLYTAGPLPLSYLGLGEIFVFAFFGPVAVAGTYLLQTLEFDPIVVMAGIAPGLFSVAILTVNNLRDIVTDKKVGKKTLAVRFGPDFAKAVYFYSILGACSIPVILYLMTQDYPSALYASLIFIFFFPLFRAVMTNQDGPSLNGVLAKTGRWLLIYSVAFSIGWLM